MHKGLLRKLKRRRKLAVVKNTNRKKYINILHQMNLLLNVMDGKKKTNLIENQNIEDKIKK